MKEGYLPVAPRLKTRTCGARLTSSVSKFGGNFRRAARAARPYQTEKSSVINQSA